MSTPISDCDWQTSNIACPRLSDPSNGDSRTLMAALAASLVDMSSARDGLNE